MKITLRKLRSILNRRFDGVLKAGSHYSNVEACALELCSVAKGINWTDSPEKTNTWDLRELNDITVPDDVRAKHMLPVIAAYADCLDWPKERQQRVAERLAVLTVNRLIAALPGLPDNIAQQCRDAKNLAAAEAASRASRAEAARASRVASWAAAEAARAAAGEAAAGEASTNVFILACQLWLDAAKEQ